MNHPRPCVVQKYGGSSMADVACIRQVAERVVQTRRSGKNVVVVVSAMGNTTNELLALAQQVSPTPGRRELDLLISVGERVSMTLLAMAIEELGEPAASFTGSQCGIITDEKHVAATVLEVRPHRVERALDEGRIAIVAGFQGVSRAGDVTTLGRGGSDTTAVVLTAALGAEHCEICSDVEGVFSADPRVVEGAQHHDELSLDSALAMARSGAKVLLAEALEKARSLGVTLQASSTRNPAGSGTRISPGPVADGVVAVTADDALEALWAPENTSFDAFAGATRAWIPDKGGTWILVDRRNLDDPDSWTLPDGVVRQGPVATVSAIGQATVRDPEVVQRSVEAVRSVDPEARWWAADSTFSSAVEPGCVEDAQRALHAALLDA